MNTGRCNKYASYARRPTPVTMPTQDDNAEPFCEVSTRERRTRLFHGTNYTGETSENILVIVLVCPQQPSRCRPAMHRQLRAGCCGAKRASSSCRDHAPGSMAPLTQTLARGGTIGRDANVSVSTDSLQRLDMRLKSLNSLKAKSVFYFTKSMTRPRLLDTAFSLLFMMTRR